jgi:GH24 family phage-related lysozyme (muramidase)
MPFRPQKRSLAAILGATAAAGMIAFTGGNECDRGCVARGGLAPFNDTVGAHVETVCFGETNVPMRRYTLAECKQILADSLADYAEAVRTSTADFDTLTDGQKFAAIDYAYNRGVGNWRATSTQDCKPQDCPDIRSAYIARDFPAACEMYVKWAKVKRKKKWFDCSDRSNGCYGIYTRRIKERAACLGE